MTRVELAKDRLYCWNLIQRARRVGFPVPDKWMRHGEPPDVVAQLHEALWASDYPQKIFQAMNLESPLFRLLNKKRGL